MSSIAGLTGKFRVQGPEARVAKKYRPTLACTTCRRLKLRCDKGQPCSNCVKRESGDQCMYGQPDVSSNATQGVAEERLAHLESMVISLMQSQAPGAPHDGANGDIAFAGPPSNPSSEAVPDMDTYTGSTHWSAMLNDIHELKASLQLTMPSPSASMASTDLGSTNEVIYGLSSSYSIDQILQQLPGKDQIDRYLSIFFSGETFILPIVHTNAFRRKYDDFWTQTSTINTLWLSILCSIAYMAARIDSSGATTAKNLHMAAGQCLVLGQYNRPQRYVVEALVLYAQSKNFQSMDPSPEAGAILGVAVRHAHTMGYHRDPAHLEILSTFEAEMRRRTWATCKQMDLMLSFQLGLPSHIRLENCDTRSPSNLLDADFDEDTVVLPMPRSANHATRLLWFIVKDRQMPMFSKICQNALAVTDTCEAEVWELDSEVHRTFSTVPKILQARTLEDSTADSPFLIMTRIYIEFIYLKSLCVLHRRFVARGIETSVVAATAASTKLIQRFISVETENQPGGVLEHHQWMINSFTLNDFLLGVTTLCLSVASRLRTVKQGGKRTFDGGIAESIGLLKQALIICEQRSLACKDALKVSQALALLVNNCQLFERQNVTGAGSDRSEGMQLTLDTNGNIFDVFSEVPAWLAEPTIADFSHFDPFNYPTGQEQPLNGFDEVSMAELSLPMMPR